MGRLTLESIIKSQRLVPSNSWSQDFQVGDRDIWFTTEMNSLGVRKMTYNKNDLLGDLSLKTLKNVLKRVNCSFLRF